MAQVDHNLQMYVAIKWFSYPNNVYPMVQFT